MDKIERIAEERFVEAMISLWIQPDAPEWIIEYVLAPILIFNL